MRLRVVAADDSPECLQKLGDILRSTFNVVATAVDGTSALKAIREFKPDVAVLDLQMPGLSGIEITRELRKDSPTPAVVICSVHEDPAIVQAAMDAGALGYVFKSECARDLSRAVKTVAAGKIFQPHDGLAR
jgi:DNA-binding NarL/FixJ family response regulator